MYNKKEAFDSSLSWQIFRDIVQRSSDVLPALAGPTILVVASIHLFVYLGMALWGGAVDIGAHPGLIEDLYDLNNFNSYAEGAVTMFQVLVVNDWHAVANVFLFAERCSSPYIVFPFFICGNLVGVSIMLNVLTAFFVESFVTKMEEKSEGEGEVSTTKQKERDFSIVSERPLRRVTSAVGNSNHESDSENDRDGSVLSDGSSGLYEFDIYERQGFDTIMQAVSGAQSPYFAQQICGFLEIFESMSPGRESVGYLICDQSTLDRFGNQRFRTKAVGFLRDDELNIVVSDMHSELMALSSRVSFKHDRVLVRKFSHKMDPSKVLEISAALLQQQPALSIFVSRTKREQPNPATIPE